MNGMLKGMFEQQGIDVYMGAGVIKDEHTVTVNDEELQTENIVIATGQHSNKLDIEGKELTHDSRDFLSMDELPKRMTFIGVGIMEASIMIKSGVEVTMIHHSDKPLKGFNQTHVTQLIKN